MNNSTHNGPLCVKGRVVAGLLGVSLRQLERLTSSRKIPGAMKIGGSRRYYLPAILSYIEDQAAKRRDTPTSTHK